MIVILWSFLAVTVGLSVADLTYLVARQIVWRYHWRRDSVRSHRVLMERINAVRKLSGCRYG